MNDNKGETMKRADEPGEARTGMASVNGVAMRVSGKGQLRQRAEAHRHLAEYLDTLCDMLPEKLTPEQDHALWMIGLELKR